VTNTVGPDEPPYVSGGNPDLVGGYGIYPGRLAVNFPAGTGLTVRSGPEAERAGSDGASEALTAAIRVAPGERVTWVVEYELGQPLDALRILPSGRSPGIHWTAPGQEWDDARRPRNTVELPT
jgi:hypothetical protein